MLKELKFPGHFFSKNREKLAKKIKDNSVVFILSSHIKSRSNDTNFRFRQDSNFFYFTGLELNRAVLMMSKINGKVSTILFRKVLSEDKEKWLGKNTDAEEIKNISRIDDLRDIVDLGESYSYLFGSSIIEDVYLYNEVNEGELVPSYTQVFASNLKKRYNFLKISSLNNMITEQRVIKQPIEIKMIRRAIEISGKGFRAILKNMKPKMYENEIEAYLSFEFLKENAKHHAYEPIVASGINATTLHYEDNDAKTGKDDLVLIDAGAEYKNYASDITRTFPVSGKFNKEQKLIYNTVLDAHKKVLKLIKPGMTFDKLQDVAKESMFNDLKKAKILKKKEDLANFYYHGLGHYMGLDVHDIGERNAEFKKGMVFTIEPGLYIADKKIGVRLENNILVTENGYENLSKSIPIEIDEIEKIMGKGNV